MAAPGVVVLDTNVALDWLVFREPEVAPLIAAIGGGRLVWIACHTMRTELVQMLNHPSLAAWHPDAAAALAIFDHHARLLPDPDTLPATRPRCADADDQVFIDLALTGPAQWLLTRDKALLKLARRARGYGVEIRTPSAWAATDARLDAAG